MHGGRLARTTVCTYNADPHRYSLLVSEDNLKGEARVLAIVTTDLAGRSVEEGVDEGDDTEGSEGLSRGVNAENLQVVQEKIK